MDVRRRAGLAALLPAVVLIPLLGQAPQAWAHLASSTGPYPARLETLLGALAVLVAVTATAWLTVLSTIALAFRAARTPVPPWVLALAPRSWRPVVAAVAGAAVLAAAPASATTGSAGSPGSSGASSASAAAVPPPASALQGLPLPDRPGRLGGPAGRAANDATNDADSDRARRAPAADRANATDNAAARRAARTAVAPAPPESSVHRVGRGETLWSIAADDLRTSGLTASATRIDRSWRRWYAANRAVIGDDPNALRIGLVLRRPASSSAAAPAASSPTPSDEGES